MLPWQRRRWLSETPSAAEAVQVSRRQTVEDLASKLVDRFVKPEVGKKYAAMLRANAAAGKYDGLTGDAEFAKQVTADIQAISFDGHLKLVPVQPAGASGGGSRRGIPETIEAQARLGDVAYIRLAKFFGEPEEVAAVEKFVTDNIDAKTMILDVRTHIGGGLDEMDAIFPYLFDKETVLVGMDTRLNVNSPLLDDGPRVRRVASPQGVVRREHFVVPKAGSPSAKAKVFVLASGRTGSAGEHFVLSLKQTGRATVVGETTYGAGNFGSTEQIAGGFQAFIPITHLRPRYRQGLGLFRDRAEHCGACQQASVEALVRSGVARDQAEIFSAKYGPAAADVTSTRKAPASVAGDLALPLTGSATRQLSAMGGKRTLAACPIRQGPAAAIPA